MSTANITARRPTTVEVVESYLLDHLEGAWPDLRETAPAPVAEPPPVLTSGLATSAGTSAGISIRTMMGSSSPM